MYSSHNLSSLFLKELSDFVVTMLTGNVFLLLATLSVKKLWTKVLDFTKRLYFIWMSTRGFGIRKR